MELRRPAIAVGVGATAFILASVVGFEVFGADFPTVFIVLPIALVTAVVAMIVTGVATGRDLQPPVVGVLAGVAAFGYAVFLQLATRYSIPATRRALQVDVIVVIATLAAVLTAAGVWYDATRPGHRI